MPTVRILNLNRSQMLPFSHLEISEQEFAIIASSTTFAMCYRWVNLGAHIRDRVVINRQFDKISKLDKWSVQSDNTVIFKLISLKN